MAVKYHDYYATLGVERSASQEQIQSAYRKLARRYHPDVNKKPEAEQKFKEVTEAYEVLKDPEKRRRYDALGSNWQAGEDFRPPPGWDGFGARQTGTGAGGYEQTFRFTGSDGGEPFDFFSGGFSDFFQSLFGGFGGGSGGGFGGFGGFGAEPDTAGARRGSGRAQSGSRPRRDDHEAEITMPLEEAYRGGKRTVALTIDEAGPGGVVQRKQKSYEVTIPPGIQDGRRLRLGGQGGRSGGAQAGDLFLKIRIAPHPVFRINAADLEADLPVAPWEAALGARVEAPLVDGTATVTVPPGSQSGKKLRLKGKGLRREGSERGDLYLVLRIVTPEHLTSQERDLFLKLAEVSTFNPRRH
ncbi:MAG: J domain-containing protein [Spirochaetaceae bacterium]|nr:MAG: J domain-containing protein [Spirochaetaceae bacterium]